MKERPSHILNAASNLLGICLVVIAGLNVSRVARTGFADEIAWGAAMCFAVSCLLSYLTLRHERRERLERIADRTFLAGLYTLIIAIAVLAIESR